MLVEDNIETQINVDFGDHGYLFYSANSILLFFHLISEESFINIVFFSTHNKN